MSRPFAIVAAFATLLFTQPARAFNERPTWIGGAISGRAGRPWSYRGNAAVLRRRAITVRLGLGGPALDGGVARRWTIAIGVVLQVYRSLFQLQTNADPRVEALCL